MPALPSPDSFSRDRASWRRALAGRLRQVAAWVDPARSAGVAGVESTTAARAFDLDGAPEHWVALLRNAGLAPSAARAPVVRSALRAIPRLWGAKTAQQVAAPQVAAPQVAAPQTASSRASGASSVDGPAVRPEGPPFRATQAPQRDPGLASSAPATSGAGANETSKVRSAHPTGAHESHEAEAADPNPPAARPTERPNEPPFHTEQSPPRSRMLSFRADSLNRAPIAAHESPEAHAADPNPPAAKPAERPNEPTFHAEQAPQRSRVLSFRAPAASGRKARQTPEAPTTSENPAAPEARSNPPAARPALRSSEPTFHAERAPQRSGQNQAHTPDPAHTGVWPELLPRPTRAAPMDGTSLTRVINRQARLHQEHGAL